MLETILKGLLIVRRKEGGTGIFILVIGTRRKRKIILMLLSMRVGSTA